MTNKSKNSLLGDPRKRVFAYCVMREFLSHYDFLPVEDVDTWAGRVAVEALAA